MRIACPTLTTIFTIIISELCTRSHQLDLEQLSAEVDRTRSQDANLQNVVLGCMFSDNLCNTEEICFDDLVFGRCISVTQDPADDELQRFPDLSEADKALITVELDRLEEAGLAWDEFYTQCILQNILGSIQFGSEFVESDCNIFLTSTDQVVADGDENDDLNDEDIPEGFLDVSDTDEDEADIPSGAVPKKSPLTDLSLVDSNPDEDDSETNDLITDVPNDDDDDIKVSEEAVITVNEQPDGSIIIDSNNEELLNEYLESFSGEPALPEEGVEEQEVIPAKRSVAPEWYDDSQADDVAANNREMLDLQNFLTMRAAVREAAEEEALLEELEAIHAAEDIERAREELEEQALEDAEAERALYEIVEPPSQAEEAFPELEQQLASYPDYVPSSQMRKLRKRTENSYNDIDADSYAVAPPSDDAEQFGYAQMTQEQQPLVNVPEEEAMMPQLDAGQYYPDYPLPGYQDDYVERPEEPYYLASSADQPAGPEIEADYPDYESEYSDISEASTPPSGHSTGNVLRLPGGGLGSNIFNRNERLDVKKPGPFFINSPNNFFLDKLLNSETEEKENLSGDKKNNETEPADVGQVEYEMPLLAPAKEKKDLVVSREGPQSQGTEPQYVHIVLKKRFDTWQQGSNLIKVLAEEFGLPDHALDARTIEDHHVQFHVRSNPASINAHQMAKRIDEDGDLRERIKEQTGAVIGRAAAGQEDAATSELYLGGSNFNLLVLTVVTASAAAALLVIGLVAFCVRRRARAAGKVNKTDLAEAERGKAQEEYQQLCRDWSRSSKKLDSSASKAQTSAVKKLQQRDSKDSDRSSTSSWPEEPNTTNMDISTGHMVLAYMEDHLKNKQRLEQEWVALCGYEAEPCATTIAFKAENKKKNRYPDKLPFDHNRVILNAMVNGSNSDYINASTVTDHDPRNPSYIVSQAPLANTVADFWQMIWEQGCVVIVMLTRLQDNGHQLCQRYWPEEGSEQYHIFEVHLVSEHTWCDDYLVRSVYLKNTRTGETRTVTQFHFRSWPAHGVPTSTKALLEFRRKVNKSYRGRSCPIAVHCSDGVGRSGTYILIDMVLNRLSKGCKEIDIAATLEHIRDQRGGMVQTRPQFEFCLMAVAEEVHAILKALPQ